MEVNIMGYLFQTKDIKFEETKDNKAEKTVDVEFDSRITGAWAALSGYRMSFTKDELRIQELGVMIEGVTIRDTGTAASVSVSLFIRDDKGFDDPFDGDVKLLVIAEAE